MGNTLRELNKIEEATESCESHPVKTNIVRGTPRHGTKSCKIEKR